MSITELGLENIVSLGTIGEDSESFTLDALEGLKFCKIIMTAFFGVSNVLKSVDGVLNRVDREL